MRDADGGRECGCPPWTIECAHYEGREVNLVDNELQLRPSPGSRYVVATWPGIIDTWTTIPAYWGDDYDAALAAFREAEARLLAAEEEGL